MIEKKLKLSESQLRMIFTLFAAFIACRVIYIQHGWVNDDSILYFEVARLFSLGEWKQGLALYNWPLYPATLSLLHQATGASFQLAAQFLNVAFFSITTYSLITIIRLSGGNKLTMLCGALLLFSTKYLTGSVLPMLLRDQGFWAFFLLSIQFFIQFYRSKEISHAILWQLCILIAALFRVEAFSFLILLPLILLSKENSARAKTWIYSNVLSLTGGSLITIVLAFNQELTLNNLGRLRDLLSMLNLSYINITQTFLAKAQIMNEQILGGYLDSYGMMGIILTMTAILISKCLLSPGWIASLLLLSNWGKSSADIAPDALKITLWIISIAILNAAVILTSNFILSGRYIASLSFIMIVLASFSLANFFRSPKSPHKNILVIITISFLGLSIINNMLPKNNEYNYEQHAVNWIKEHNKLHAPVYYTTPSTRYYAGEPYAGRGYDDWQLVLNAIESGSIQQYKYLVIPIQNYKPEKEQVLFKGLSNYNLIKEVMGFRSKKKIMIFIKKE